MTRCYVGIDTSNYTTSAALADEAGEVISNIKIPLRVGEGGVGLRQSDALFAHIKNLPRVMEELRGAMAGRAPAAVGYSSSPRDGEGSYMPCFLAGVAAAEALAAGAGVPACRFSHQAGHIMAAAYSSGEEAGLLASPFCAAHVSGGTTELLHVTPSREGFEIKPLGGTLDLNAGQAIDRAGVAMGLEFPCGPELERLAGSFTGTVPGPRVSVRGLECNLSGLENQAAKLYAETSDPPLVAAFVLDFVGRTLVELTKNLRASYAGLPLLCAGGVMGNSIIRAMLEPLGGVYFARPAFSSDNAAGTALLARRRFGGA